MKFAHKSGLYVITDPNLLPTPTDLIRAVTHALDVGVAMVQYRNKQADFNAQCQQASQLKAVCEQYKTPLIVNDNIDLAKTIEADGVHIGQNDSKIASVRDQLGKSAIIGVTCHASLELAQTAIKQGADYIAFGRFFPSQTKPHAPPADVDILKQAKIRWPEMPIVAIGGITHQNGQVLLDAGADYLAAIHSVFGVSDTKQAVQNFHRLMRLNSVCPD